MAILIKVTSEQLDFMVKLLAKAQKIKSHEVAKETVRLEELADNFRRAKTARGTDGVVHLHIDKPEVVQSRPPSAEGAGLFSDDMPEWEVMQMIRRIRVLPVRVDNGGTGGDGVGRLLKYLGIKPVEENKD